MTNKNIFYLSTANLLSSLGTGLTTFLIPWLLITGKNCEQIYTSISISTTLLIFLLIPTLGTFIDTYSRKRITLLCEFIDYNYFDFYNRSDSNLNLIFILPQVPIIMAHTS